MWWFLWGNPGRRRLEASRRIVRPVSLRPVGRPVGLSVPVPPSFVGCFARRRGVGPSPDDRRTSFIGYDPSKEVFGIPESGTWANSTPTVFLHRGLTPRALNHDSKLPTRTDFTVQKSCKIFTILFTLTTTTPAILAQFPPRCPRVDHQTQQN